MIPTIQPAMSGLTRLTLLRPISRSLLTTPAIRHKSLSAVHRGLRSTERAGFGEGRRAPRNNAEPDFERPSRRRDSDGPPRGEARGGRKDAKPWESRGAAKPTSRDAKPWESRGAGRPKLGRDEALTEKALSGAKNPAARARLVKKLAKKAEEDLAKEDGPQSRRKRFNDKEAEFGRKSLVYQLKHGALKDLAMNTKMDEPVQARSFRSIKRDQVDEKIKKREERRQDVGEEAGEKRSLGDQMRDGRVGEKRGTERRSATSGRTERARFERENSFERSDKHGERFGRDRNDRSDRNDRHGDRSGRERNDRDGGTRGDRRGDRDGERRDREERQHLTDPEKAKRGGFMPMTIKYTTASSQFLYGRSVVHAALSASRRNIHHLYLYAGSKGGDMEPIRRLAQSKEIPTTVVPVSEQRLMDKMSAGRPHNGFVLETSPLPQKPVVSLGGLKKEGGKNGFEVVLDHQSREEESVNGKGTFVQRATSTTPNPLVLVLHEILDPGNLGALIRTASYLGIDAVGITSRASSTLTPVVLKSAAGAVEEVSIFTIDNPVEFVNQSKAAGWTTFAAVAPPQKKLQKLHSRKFISSDAVEFTRPLSEGPCMLILGNEGYGLPKDIKVAADREISVPRFVQGSSVDSLNVSVAAGLLCHSFVKGFDGPAATLEKEFAAEAEKQEKLKEEEEAMTEKMW